MSALSGRGSAESGGAPGPASCAFAGCSTARLGESGCIAHVSDAELDAAVDAWRLGEALDAREATIDAHCLGRLLDALLRVEIAPKPAEVTRLRPRSCGSMHFEGAIFEDDPDFSGLTFPGPMLFDGATFEGSANFGDSTFAEHADFDHVVFQGHADFREAVLDDHAGFEGAKFDDLATFEGAKFRSYVDLDGARFAGELGMRAATFQLARQLGPFAVAGRVTLDTSVFSERISIDAGADTISAQGTVFADGVRMSLTGAALNLERADLGRASTLADNGRSGVKPTLLTLRGARVAGAAISGVDLTGCRFVGAHGLEKLNIEANCRWLHTPEDWRCIDREMIAEEHAWRRDRERRRGVGWRRRLRPRADWVGDKHGDDESEPRAPLDTGQLAGLYRALRKAREDSNDQAGAGDLYYGEMEMRRQAPMSWGPGKWHIAAEKILIAGYRLIAGYGLRASRSLMVLSAVILITSLALTRWGFTPTKSFLGSVRFAAQSSLVLTHPPEVGLTRAGKVLELAIRVAGPALVALTILSLRSRIKR